MLTSKTIKLILAIALVAAGVTALNVDIRSGRSAARNTITRKLLRRHDKTKGPPTSAEVAFLRAQEQVTEERQLEDTVPKHVPIKIKIKAEKEKAFKDLNNEKWLRDLEFEVKNTGTKPIYFLVFIVDMPETRGPDGNLIGFDFHYGRTNLIDLEEPLKSQDVPINPGESHTFRLAERFLRGWDRIVRENKLAHPKKVRILFQFINFGDGTGLDTTTAVPASRLKRASNNRELNDRNAKTTRLKQTIPKWPILAFNRSQEPVSFQAEPAFLPASFLSKE
jgi:hypothetical protein